MSDNNSRPAVGILGSVACSVRFQDIAEWPQNGLGRTKLGHEAGSNEDHWAPDWLPWWVMPHGGKAVHVGREGGGAEVNRARGVLAPVDVQLVVANTKNNVFSSNSDEQS